MCQAYTRCFMVVIFIQVFWIIFKDNVFCHSPNKKFFHTYVIALNYFFQDPVQESSILGSLPQFSLTYINF